MERGRAALTTRPGVMPMIDFELTEEQLALQKIAREFSEKEIRTIAE